MTLREFNALKQRLMVRLYPELATQKKITPKPGQRDPLFDRLDAQIATQQR